MSNMAPGLDIEWAIGARHRRMSSDAIANGSLSMLNFAEVILG
jgi:hypothetical protein